MMEGCGRHKVQERVAHVPASRSDNGCVQLPSPPGVLVVHKDEPCMNKHQAIGAKVRWNVRRDCGVESKPRLSGGTLSIWTGRSGVSWMETVVTQSGHYRSGGSQRVLKLTLCNHEFLPYRERL